MGAKGANYILEYYQKINDGTIIAGKWIHRLYDLIIKKLEAKELFFDPKKAADAVDYIENCHHVEGPLAPDKIQLELWQKAFLSCQYGLVDDNGVRAFREILLLIARKQGKSVIASAEAKYNFLKDGGYGARVYNIAPKLDQADIVYNNLWTMITLDEDWIARRDKLEADKKSKARKDDPELARHRMTDLYLPSTNSTAKKIAFSAKKSDGFNPSLVICDEIASWPGDQGLKQYGVLKSGMGARPEAQILSCTTSGYLNDGIFDDLIKRATRFLMGESKEKRLLPFLYMIDDVEKWDDINELQKANPNLGVSVSVDYILDEIEVARGSLSSKAEFLTKYCCIKQNSSLAWLPAEVVNNASGKELRPEDFRNCYAVCGIDLSQTTDLTCALVIIEKAGELYVIAKFFMPSERVDTLTAEDGLPYNAYVQRGLLHLSGGNYVDYHDVYNWLINLVEEYEILPLMVGYDRYSAQYLIKDLDNYGFRCDDVFQGENLYPVIQETEGLLRDGKIHIGDNDLLKIHLLNSAIKMSVERGRGKLVKINARDHIDGCAAILDAMCVRQKWYGELGDRLRNED